MDGPNLLNQGSLALWLFWFRRLNGGLGFTVIILAACTAPTTPTTASSAPTTTSTTVVPSTSTSTTVAVDSPVDICLLPGVSAWEIGATYVAPCFLTPLQFTPADEGWSSIRTDLEWVEGVWTEPGESTPAIRFVILAYEPQSTPDEVIASILAIESVEPVTEPAADGEQLSVDVATGPISNPTIERECMSTFSRAFDITFGETVLLERGNLFEGEAYGMGACWTFRIWATTVADTTITVIATTADLERFDELMPTAERLVRTIERAAR